MLKVDEIKTAIELLPEDEFARLRRWLYDRDWERWDKQVGADSASGELDFLISEAQEGKQRHDLEEL